MKVFVSSTSTDLGAHRAAAIRSLRRLGHQVIAMEDFTAATAYPLDRVLELVRSADGFVLIVAWRYGYIPQTPPAERPLARSLTTKSSHCGAWYTTRCSTDGCTCSETWRTSSRR